VHCRVLQSCLKSLKHRPLKDLLADYHAAFMGQVSHSVACNYCRCKSLEEHGA